MKDVLVTFMAANWLNTIGLKQKFKNGFLRKKISKQNIPNREEFFNLKEVI